MEVTTKGRSLTVSDMVAAPIPTQKRAWSMKEIGSVVSDMAKASFAIEMDLSMRAPGRRE